MVATLRLPRRIFHRLHASDAVADAGFRVLSDFDAAGMPKDTAWVSFRVECPTPMDNRTLVRRLAALCH